MPPVRRYLSIVALLAAASVGPAHAGNRRAKSAGPVRYAKVDGSTLRVFALGTVGVGADGAAPVATPQAGHGTGFAVEPDLIVTAEHVVHGARHVVIRRPGAGGFLPARVVFSDADEDIAILHVDAKLPRIRMHKSDYVLRVRQTVFAIGYPLDPSRTQAQSARGIIAGHLDNASLQLDISLNPGNSGGPLVDESDQVVGMVVSRGDVKRGVQGVGMAVPVRKLRVAIAAAHEELASGNVDALTAHDRSAAQIVDELIRTGALPLGDSSDFDTDFDKQIDVLARKLDDSDLLVFFAGNLWNTAVAIEQRKVRAIRGHVLSAQEATALAQELRTAAIRLARRGDELDKTLHERSRFVELALASDRDADEDDVDEDELADEAPASGDPWDRAHAVPASATATASLTKSAARPPRAQAGMWTIQSSPELRLVDGARTFGGELELRRKLQRRSSARLRLFGSLGASAALSVDGADPGTRPAHSFVALEAGAGLSIAVGRASHLDLYGGVAPSYYSVSPDIHSPMTRQSDYVLDHYRATATLAVSWLTISTGVRSISSTLWVEPVGLGVTF